MATEQSTLLGPKELPTEYRGWKLRWYVWFNQKTIHPSEWSVSGDICGVCGKDFIIGDELYAPANRVAVHWTCEYPDNPRAPLQAYWICRKTVDGYERHMYAMCSPETKPSGPIERGMAMVLPNTPVITEDSTEEDKNVAREAGLIRIKLLIDQDEDTDVNNETWAKFANARR